MPVQRPVTNLSELVRSVISMMHTLQPARELAVDARRDRFCSLILRWPGASLKTS